MGGKWGGKQTGGCGEIGNRRGGWGVGAGFGGGVESS